MRGNFFNQTFGVVLLAFPLAIHLAFPLVVKAQPKNQDEDEAPARDLSPARSSVPPSVVVASEMDRAEQLKLLNGDKMSGEFLGMDNGRVQWKHPSANVLIPFEMKDVATLTISNRTNPKEARLHSSSVGLINGDRLLGELVELTPENLLLDTWYAGRLKIPRASIFSVNPVLRKNRVLYENREGDATGWLFGNYNKNIAPKAKPGGEVGVKEKKAQEIARQVLAQKIVPANQLNVPANGSTRNYFWKFDGTGFTSNASGAVIARTDINYSDKFELAFDVQWMGGTSCYFHTAFLASSVKDSYSGDHYRLQVSSGYFYFYRRTKNGNQIQMGRAELRDRISGKSRMRIGLLVDRLQREVTLTIDGEVIKTYRDGGKDPLPLARGLAFQSNNTYPLRISKIKVSHWNGKLPTEEVKSDGAEDFIFFKNKDHVKGQVKSIRDGRVIVNNSSFGEVPVPLSKVARLRLANPSSKLDPKQGDARAMLVHSGVVSGIFEKWTDDKVILKHPHMGILEMHPSIFQSLELNRDKPRPKKQHEFFSK